MKVARLRLEATEKRRQVDEAPGLHVDEAINALNALGIAVRGNTPIYFENSDGREILLPYLMAGALKAFGIGLFTLKLVPLAMSLLTICLVFALGREVLTRLEEHRMILRGPQQNSGARGQGLATYFHDPDGIEIELKTYDPDLMARYPE